MTIQEELTTEVGLEVGVEQALLERSLRAVARAVGALSAYCEHVEHLEPSTVADVVRAGVCLRDAAVDLSRWRGISLAAAYAERITAVEAKRSLRNVGLGALTGHVPGAAMLATAQTWREIQTGQLQHDLQFHPDVYFNTKLYQVQHYANHVGKLVGLLVEAIEHCDWDRFGDARLADVAIFGVKLATLCDVDLPKILVDR